MGILSSKYYSLDNILKRNALYNIVIGERSNGKTFAVLKYQLERYVRTGEQLAILRRWSEDFIGKRGAVMFDGIVATGLISKITRNEWSGVHYYGSRWYLCKIDDSGKKIISESPFAFGFSLSSMEHDKSTSYPNISTILFDEFLTRTYYLPDEFVIFMNCLSTIIRDRQNVKIFMMGNTVTKNCPYFKEMGLKHLRDMKPGDIDVYSYGNSGLTVAVEMTKPGEKGKKSDKYFAFDNPKLNMITHGSWELGIYPHCPVKYEKKHVRFVYYIKYDGQTLACEVVEKDGDIFTFIRPQTRAICPGAIIYQQEFDPAPNIRRRITYPTDELDKKLLSFFKREKVFYATNDVGEIVFNYLNWCKNS